MRDVVTIRILGLVLLALISPPNTSSFSPSPTVRRTQNPFVYYNAQSTTTPATTSLRLSSEPEFSRDVRLREEAESPFRKVRYFLYLNLAGGALSSLFISVTRIAAAASGVNVDLMDESVRNAVVDVAGLIGVTFFWRQDSAAEESRLKRATKGAELAKLNVRANKALLLGDLMEESDNDDAIKKPSSSFGSFTTTLASFRRQRGIEKRVVLAAAGPDRIQQVLDEAKGLQADLADNDLVVVPVVMPAGVAPNVASDDCPANVALPVSVGNNWKRIMEEEAVEALSQGVDIQQEGFCVILKKNGRVGQRTRGIFLNNLVGNVVARKEAGMDVKNI